MALAIGDTLPDGTLTKITETGPETVSLGDLGANKKLVLFGLPGAFTRTCSAAHLPGFVRNADAFRAKGVDHIVCMSVNDPFVMQAWDDVQGAAKAGVELLSDGDSSVTKSLGFAFTMESLGFIDRCKRFSAYVENGVVKALNFETEAGTCDLTAAETLLDQI